MLQIGWSVELWLADILWCCLSVPLVAVVAPVAAPVAVVALAD